MQVVAKYEYDQNCYAIALENDCITFLKWCGNKYKECSDNKERSLAFEILSSLIPNESNGEYIKDIVVNNHIYNLFYDAMKKLYYWHNKDGNNYEADNIYLNQRYNHTLLVLYYNGKKNKKTKDYIFRLFYKNKRAIALVLAASISLSTLAGKDVLGMSNHNITYQDLFSQESISKIIDEKANLLQSALDCNPNLKPEEKEAISKLSFIFSRYQGIVNEQVVLERFRTLRIEYEGTIESAEAGYYNRIENKIVLHYTDFEHALLSIFIHEVLHVFQMGNGVHFLEELSNEYFTREVILELLNNGTLTSWQLMCPNNKKSHTEEEVNNQSMDEKLFHLGIDCFNGYDYYIDLYYLLAQLLDENDLARFQFDGNLTIIEKALLRKLSPSEENMQLVNKLSNATYFLRPIETGEFNFYFDKSKCYTILNELYFKIKGYHLYQDAASCAYISKYGTSNITEDYEVFMNYSGLGPKVIIPKTIFSDFIPNPIILYRSNSLVLKKEINQEFQDQYGAFLENKMNRTRT